MSLWIRSQDKESLLECKTFAVSDEIQYNPKEHIGEFDIFCENGILGFYSTKEKALKVLDMIQTRICSIKKLELIGNILNVSSPSEIAFDEENKFVFQMPLDESL